MPFNKEIASNILATNVGTYVGLLTSVSNDGDSHSEPVIDTSPDGENGGYQRGQVTWLTSKQTNIYRHIANKDLVLMYEARGDEDWSVTFTHFGLFKTATDKDLIFYGELANPLVVTNGSVPLIRAAELIIAMDVAEEDLVTDKNAYLSKI